MIPKMQLVAGRQYNDNRKFNPSLIIYNDIGDRLGYFIAQDEFDTADEALEASKKMVQNYAEHTSMVLAIESIRE